MHHISPLLALVAALVPGVPADAAQTGRNVVIGYYFLSPDQINQYDENDPKAVPFPVSRITPDRARMLTHINLAFLDINDKSECCWDAKVKPEKALDLARKLVALRKHNSRLRILYSVGGWHYSNDSGPSVKNYRLAVATPEARARLARSCVKMMMALDFDGIDIDWEYPRAEDAAPFVEALKAIRKLLDGENVKRKDKPYQLTIAGAGGAFFLSRYHAQLLPMVEQLDYLNLMTYDLAGPWEKTTNHHAALFGDPAGPKFYNALREARDDLPWEEKVKRHPSPFALTVDAAVQQHRIAGVPAGKIVMGVPFYCRAFRGVAGDRGQYSAHSTPAGDPYVGEPDWLVGCKQASEEKEPRLATYAQIKELLRGDFGYERHWNDMTKTPWLYNKKHRLFLTYDDEESLATKARYIKEQQLGGVMFWHLGQDDAVGSLLRTLHRCLNDTSHDDSKVTPGKGQRYEGRGPHQLPLMNSDAWNAGKVYQQGAVTRRDGFVWKARYYQNAGEVPSLKNGWEMIGQWKAPDKK